MSVWVSIDVAIAVIGLAVLGLLGWRLWTQVRVLGRTVTAAGDRIAAVQSELDRTSRQRVPNSSRGLH